MVLSYLAKQIQHARACRVMGAHIDLVLVARSMLEGCSQILWAESDRAVRAGRWRLYAWIEEWRDLKDRAQRGAKIDQAYMASVEAKLREKEFEDLFLTEPARKARSNGRPLPRDPFSRRWHGQTETQLFETTAARPYRAAYREFSEWHHWNPYGFREAIQITKAGASFAPHYPRVIAYALSCAFQCLRVEALCADRHVLLNLTAEVEALRSDLEQRVGA
jgi:hypothetical protein